MIRFAAVFLVLMASWAGRFAWDASAQDAASTDATANRAAAYQAAQRAHLWRVAAWGGLNAAGGLALMASGRSRTAHPTRWGFGVQSAAWGLINVGIATVGHWTLDAPPTEAAALRDAERRLHDILLFNLGLNVGYAGVGAALVAAGAHDVDHARSWRGHGSALILQGAGLFVLDGIAWLAARSRLADLIDVTGDLSARALPAGWALTVTL